MDSEKEKFSETLKMPSFFVPSLFLIYLLVLPTLYFISKMFLIPLGLYIILSLIASFYEGIINKDLKSVFVLPFIFLAIHISYGLGFLYGFIVKISQ